MQAQQTNLDTIANNLANSSTSGFRSSRMQFQDLIYQNIIMPGAAASQQTTVEAGLQVGLGTRASASEVLQLQGDLTATGNQLDIAIEGNGFFQVLLPSGETAYTRAGSFHTDAQGNVVTADGNPLQPAITIPQSATTVTIAADGTVSVTVPGQTAAQQVGSIQLALFPNPGGLSSSGGSLFLATTASGDAVVGTPGGSDGLGQVEQGYLEQSNVSVVDEFINMIVAQRSYEASSRVVQAADQMFQLINNLGH
jgi:flagellar basal-body rod protein FlgG